MFSLLSNFPINPARPIISWLVSSMISRELDPFAIIKSPKSKIQLNQIPIIFCFSILSLAIVKSRKSITLLLFLNRIYSSFFRNHTKFYFVRLTLRLIASRMWITFEATPVVTFFRFIYEKIVLYRKNVQWDSSDVLAVLLPVGAGLPRSGKPKANCRLEGARDEAMSITPLVSQF